MRSLPRRLAKRLLQSGGVIARPRRLAGWSGAFQPVNHTRPDRYPDIFAFVRDQFADPAAPLNILSFGCSTGEEAMTLRRYFPGAFVTGLDVAPDNILCCLRLRDDRLRFARTNSTRGEPSAFYDAIFCMAVLEHVDLQKKPPAKCEPLIRFRDFEETVIDFARCLKPGGLLVVWRSNFRLCDTAVSGLFDPLPARFADPLTPVPRYSRSNLLLADDDYPYTVFCRR